MKTFTNNIMNHNENKSRTTDTSRALIDSAIITSVIVGLFMWLGIVIADINPVQAKSSVQNHESISVTSKPVRQTAVAYVQRSYIGSTSRISRPQSKVLDGVPKYVLKSLFFLPILLLLCTALYYAIRALKQLRRLISYAKNTKWVLTTQEAVNDYLAFVTFTFDGVIEKMQKDLTSLEQQSADKDGQLTTVRNELKSFKETTEQLLTANQVSSARSSQKTTLVNYSLPGLFEKKQVYAPIVIALGLTLLLNISLYLFDAIRITVASGLVTIGVVLFAGLLVALAYRYLWYARSSALRNQKELKQVSELYVERIEFILQASIKITERLESLHQLIRTSNNRDFKISLPKLPIIEKTNNSLRNAKQFCDFATDSPLFDITSYAKKLVKDSMEAYKAKGITIESSIDSGIVTHANPDEIRQVLKSILTNACHYSLDRGTVTVSVKRNLSKISITITDQGIGIPKDKLPSLVKPFTGNFENIQEIIDSPGLSLYVDKIIIYKLGGNFKITSTIGSGTKVLIQLPLRQSSSQANPLSLSPKSSSH